MSNGWIKLHKKLCGWEWYRDSKTLHLFIHLLLKANYRPSKWRGHALRPGQFITGRKQLSAETGISEQSIRTSLRHLESTGEIEIEPTNRFSVVTVCNYSLYQSEKVFGNQPDNQPINQLFNQRSNHIQEVKKLRSKKDTTIVVSGDNDIADGNNQPSSCPHQEIVQLYHHILPELRRVRIWNSVRQSYLRSRWREDPARQNLDWWKGFFEYVRTCPWLMGTADNGKESKLFQADLEWLVRPQNFIKTVEGKYAQ
ncbi:MAG: hypothetical protein JEY79_11880 [Pseudodesulfovibrio sp.]|nr:hypothetical protein [Pseudodesulfovibrio sp.]